MNRHAVVSSQIKSIGYDQKTQTLEVEFQRNNAVYQYAGVPIAEIELMGAAESIGKYFNAHIRDKFSFVKLPPEEVHASSEAQADATAPKDSQAQADAASADNGPSED